MRLNLSDGLLVAFGQWVLMLAVIGVVCLVIRGIFYTERKIRGADKYDKEGSNIVKGLTKEIRIPLKYKIAIGIVVILIFYFFA